MSFQSHLPNSGSFQQVVKNVPRTTVSGADAPLGSFEISKKTESLKDRVDSHRNGTPFSYITVDPQDGRSRKTIMKTLFGRKNRLWSEPVPVNQIPIIKLIEPNNTFYIGNIVSKSAFSKSLDYINLYEMMIIFRPTQGFYQDHGDVSFEIFDGRLVKNNVVKKAIAPNNVESSFYLSLDYSVYKQDLNAITLKVDYSNSAIRRGFVWGSLKVEISLKSYEEAVSQTIVPVSGFANIQQSTLGNMRTNPGHLDLTIDQETLNALKRMRARGELRNLSEPESRQKLEAFEGSEAGDSVVMSMGGSDDDQLRIAAMNKFQNMSAVQKTTLSSEGFDGSSIADSVKGKGKSRARFSPVPSFEDLRSVNSNDSGVLQTGLEIAVKCFPILKDMNLKGIKSFEEIPDLDDIKKIMTPEQLSTQVYYEIGSNGNKISPTPFKHCKSMSFNSFTGMYKSMKFL